MQEVEQKKSEKLVPIDTSGESVDIELKDDQVVDTPAEKIGRASCRERV